LKDKLKQLWIRLVALLMRYAPSERQRVFFLTIVTGALCGLAAVAFHRGIFFTERLLINQAMAAPHGWWIFLTIASPAAAGLVAGLAMFYVVPAAAGSGIPQVKAAYALEAGRVRFRDAVGKFFLGVLQIGSGASLGREGPTVQICAGVASLVARGVPISRQSRRRMLPVGAAAAIAAAFNAPIAAVTFAIEEIIGDLDQTLLTGVIVAAAIAAAVERSILGEHPVLSLSRTYGLQHASSLLLYALLGLISAAISLLFNDSLLGLRGAFKRMTAIPKFVHPAIGGAATGVMIVIGLAWLKIGGINGGGYDVLSQALAGSLPFKVLLALCFLKIAATVFSYSSGGAGGLFAPALFVGAMLGGAVGFLDVRMFGHSTDSLGAFALVGMGAVFAGVVRAPITSILIIFEMTGDYGLILPLMIANMMCYALAHHWRPLGIYDALLVQDGIVLPHKKQEMPKDELAEVKG
jgi:chloride channel protein, CIC family